MEYSKEPTHAAQVEKQQDVELESEQWEEPRVKKIKRKVDLRLSAILALM